MDSFQETVFKLKRYWADRGAIIQEPYDVEVGAGTMCPETFLRVLGPKPYRVAYVQPSRRPADGRYGENPNRLYKHQQLQVILKPSPDDVIDQYLGSLEAIGIDLKKHDIKFEEDNWEVAHAGRLGHRLAGDAGRPGNHPVHLFPAMRRHRSGPGPRRNHLRPGTDLSRSCKDVESVYDIEWAPGVKYSRRALRRRAAILRLQLRDGRTSTACGACSTNTKPSANELLAQYEKYPEQAPLPGACRPTIRS